MRVSFYTLGCKLNQAETDELKRDLETRGFFAVPWKEKTDVAIVRACGVTMGASQTTREMIRQAKKRGAYVVATGCLENPGLPEIDFSAAADEEIIEHLSALNFKLNAGEKQPLTNAPADKTRLFLKIQTGCNFNCAYCAIPRFRGRAKSIPREKIIEKIRQTEKEGFKEVVLTGVNICLYRDGDIDLAALLKIILKETNIARLRLGSMDPRLISDKLLAIYKNPRLLPHMHLSSQSGSNKILRAMNRNYTTKKYLDVIKRARALMPNFSFTTDIIVGFPQETEKDFNDSLKLAQTARFAKIHVFHFSPRPDTPAAEMAGQISEHIKTKRVKTLIAAGKKIGLEYARCFVGQTRPVLFEGKRAGYWYGYTPEYLRVKYRSNKNLTNQIVDLKITKKHFGLI